MAGRSKQVPTTKATRGLNIALQMEHYYMFFRENHPRMDEQIGPLVIRHLAMEFHHLYIDEVSQSQNVYFPTWTVLRVYILVSMDSSISAQTSTSDTETPTK